MKKALFVRKAANLNDLKAGIGEVQYETKFVVGKIIKLTQQQFEEFSENLLDDYSFISENTALMFVDTNHAWHCILLGSEKVSGVNPQRTSFSSQRGLTPQRFDKSCKRCLFRSIPAVNLPQNRQVNPV